MTGAGDAIAWANSGNMLKAQYSTAGTLDPKMKELKDKIEKGYIPNTANVKGVQGLGELEKLSEYSSGVQKIKPHQTPNTPSTITASLRSDEGTVADAGKGDELSLRSQIRRDVKQAIRDEFDEIDNEYEIIYE